MGAEKQMNAHTKQPVFIDIHMSFLTGPRDRKIYNTKNETEL